LETFEKSKEKVVPWIETYNHYYQNKSRQGESRTENHWLLSEMVTWWGQYTWI